MLIGWCLLRGDAGQCRRQCGRVRRSCPTMIFRQSGFANARCPAGSGAAAFFSDIRARRIAIRGVGRPSSGAQNSNRPAVWRRL